MSVLLYMLNESNKIPNTMEIFTKDHPQTSVSNWQTLDPNTKNIATAAMVLTLYRHFQNNGGLNQVFWRAEPPASITVEC